MSTILKVYEITSDNCDSVNILSKDLGVKKSLLVNMAVSFLSTVVKDLCEDRGDSHTVKQDLQRYVSGDIDHSDFLSVIFQSSDALGEQPER